MPLWTDRNSPGQATAEMPEALLGMLDTIIHAEARAYLTDEMGIGALVVGKNQHNECTISFILPRQGADRNVLCEVAARIRAFAPRIDVEEDINRYSHYPSDAPPFAPFRQITFFARSPDVMRSGLENLVEHVLSDSSEFSIKTEDLEIIREKFDDYLQQKSSAALGTQ